MMVPHTDWARALELDWSASSRCSELSHRRTVGRDGNRDWCSAGSRGFIAVWEREVAGHHTQEGSALVGRAELNAGSWR